MNKLYLWNRALHRDVGYLLVGLILTYVVSGIAVNHYNDWNPNYKIVKEQVKLDTQIEIASDGSVNEAVVADQVKTQFTISEKIRNTFQPDPNTLNIYFEESVATVNITTGDVELEVVRPRTLFYAVNFLHLNKAPKFWKWFADIFAVLLAYLAVSGLFMVKGKNGIRGRGAWLTALGFALPILAYLILK